MIRFNETEYIAIADRTINEMELAERAADTVTEKGFENIFFIGVGGTCAMMTSAKEILKQICHVPVYMEQAAELMATGHSQLTEKSLVIVMSKSGDTKEVVEIGNQLKKQGNPIVAFTSSYDCPIAQNSTVTVPVVKADLVEFYYMPLNVFIMRLCLNLGDISREDYEQIYRELPLIPNNLVRIKREFDFRAQEIAEQFAEEPYLLFVGGGQMWGEVINESMCVLEEALWIKTKAVSSADFFHGTLELVDEKLPVILVKGEGKERVLDDRAENFLKKTTKRLVVIDPKEYALEGIEDKFRWIYAPMITTTIMIDRMSVWFAEKTGHDMQLRRYYRQFEY